MKRTEKPWAANGLRDLPDSNSKKVSILKMVLRLLKLVGILLRAAASLGLSIMKVKEISMKKSSTLVKQTLKCPFQSMRS